MKYSFKILLLVILPSFYIYAQNSNNAMAVVSARLIKGISTETISGDLNFGEIAVSNSNTTVNKNPDEGMEIKISGEPEKNIIMTFEPIEINNSQWVSQNGGEEGAIIFTPDIEQTSGSIAYLNASPVISGNSYTLPNSNGEGEIYIWIGGNIRINDNQPVGNYAGTFQINISY